MRLVKKILMILLVVDLMVCFFESIRSEAKDKTLTVPVISVKTIESGTGVKVKIIMTKDADAYEVYVTGKSDYYTDYRKDIDSQKIAEVKNNGKSKRTIKIKFLTPGSYKIKVRSYKGETYGPKEYSEFSKEKSVKLKETANGYLSSYDFSKVKKGDVIKFGAYEQDGDFTNGKEAIEWIVLEKTKKQIFVVSKYVLDGMPYNKEWKGVVWESCTLRKWLNDKFYNIAFNGTEQAMVKTAVLKNYDNFEYETLGGNDTKDKIFLLSYQDVTNANYGFVHEHYFDKCRRCVATAYSVKQGVITDSYFLTSDDEVFCQWWVRLPGMFADYAAIVDYGGYVDHYGVVVFNEQHIGVRPAIYIDLNS